MDCSRSPKMKTKFLGWRVDNDAAAMFEYGQFIIWQECLPVIVNANRNAWVSLKYRLKKFESMYLVVGTYQGSRSNRYLLAFPAINVVDLQPIETATKYTIRI